jgi:hypothetical protein
MRYERARTGLDRHATYIVLYRRHLHLRRSPLAPAAAFLGRPGCPGSGQADRGSRIHAWPSLNAAISAIANRRSARRTRSRRPTMSACITGNSGAAPGPREGVLISVGANHDVPGAITPPTRYTSRCGTAWLRRRYRLGRYVPTEPTTMPAKCRAWNRRSVWLECHGYAHARSSLLVACGAPSRSTSLAGEPDLPFARARWDGAAPARP